MLIRKPQDIAPSEITSPELYARRRDFLRMGTGLVVSAAAAPVLPAIAAESRKTTVKLFGVKPSPLSTDEKQNTYEQVTTYNNFYEFGTDKDDPARQRPHAARAAVDGGDRGRGEEAAVARHRRPDEARTARGAHLSHALRRGLVDGDPVGRLPARAS